MGAWRETMSSHGGWRFTIGDEDMTEQYRVAVDSDLLKVVNRGELQLTDKGRKWL